MQLIIKTDQQTKM